MFKPCSVATFSRTTQSPRREESEEAEIVSGGSQRSSEDDFRNWLKKDLSASQTK